jgi:DNA invertase Pin-like site-specific DNA recombinase
VADIGYARTSTLGQHEDSQITDLKEAGCSKIFLDKCSGKNANRPGWQQCLEYLRPGDRLTITRLSRAMRNLRHMLDTAADLSSRGIALRVLRQDIDTSTPTGRLVFHILASIDEWQRELIIEGTLEGLAVARAQGKTGGRPRSLSDEDLAIARVMAAQRDAQGLPVWTQRRIAQRFSTSPATVSRALRRPVS